MLANFAALVLLTQTFVIEMLKKLSLNHLCGTVLDKRLVKTISENIQSD